MALPVYRGKFGPRQAERLLWRAGFGPRPGEARKLSKRGMKKAVLSMTRPKKKARLKGPKPKDDDGLPLAPGDAWGHDHLYWLDRMVRSTNQFEERMALVWHDWFATGDVGQFKLNIGQYELFRRRGLGSFRDLLLDVTSDPAMLIWLSGVDNAVWAPNENYAREVMELFTMGAGARYTEQDVREHARALTGWTSDWNESQGLHNFHFDPERYDPGTKKIFGRQGKFNWQDSCKLCLQHPDHPEFFVRKLWSYFVPTEPDKRTVRELKKLYKRKQLAVRPVVEAILMHPDLYKGPRMVKPPVVQLAGMLRARKEGIFTDDWVWIADDAGQRLFMPPNVSGWDDDRWLDTARSQGRWSIASRMVRDRQADSEGSYPENEDARKAVRKAIRFWGNPELSNKTEKELLRFAQKVEKAATDEWQQSSYRGLRQNALRMLIATSPDFQTS